MSQQNSKTAAAHVTNFIRNIVDADLAGGAYADRRWGGKPGGAQTQSYAPSDPYSQQFEQGQQPLDPEEVAVMGQTTSNLHQLLATLFEPAHPTRRVIVGDALNFASDTHALRSHLRLRGLDPETHLRIVPSRDGRILWIDDVLEALTDDVQLLVLPAVVFTSGQLLDVPTITRKARTSNTCSKPSDLPRIFLTML